MLERVDQYRETLNRILERDLERDDATPAARLDASEKRIGRRLPTAVRELYLLAGEAEEMRGHNRLLEPEDLEIDDGYLVFMHENQDVVHWGIPVPFSGDDPEVWQCVNGDRPDWYSEEMPFSKFIVRKLAFQLGVDLPYDH